MTAIIHRCGAVLALLTIAGAAMTARGQASFQVIPSPAGSTQEQAYTISGDGVTVLGTAIVSGSFSAWWWRGTGSPTLIAGTGTIDPSVGIGTPTDGSQAVWSSTSLFTTSSRYFIATGTYEPFPSVGNAYLHLGCLSADGAVAGGQYFVPSHDHEVGAVTSGGGFFFPGVGDAMNQGYALACSGNGNVLVGYAYAFANNQGQAFRWDLTSGAIGLGSFDPIIGNQVFSSGTGVSADGSVVVGWSLSGGAAHPFRWTAQGGLTDLGLLPGASASRANAVSADGTITIGQTTSGVAFVWDSPSGLRDLKAVLISTGAQGLGSINLVSARSISADGSTIVGQAVDQLGAAHAYLARLDPRGCYSNCDHSTVAPILNANDFQCFLNKFAAGDPYANCDGSTGAPALNAADFACFLNRFAAGC